MAANGAGDRDAVHALEDAPMLADEPPVRSVNATAFRGGDGDDDGALGTSRVMHGDARAVAIGVPVMVSARDALEDELDDVVANVIDGDGGDGNGESAEDEDEVDDARDVEGGSLENENVEDMFTQYLMPKFWFEVFGVRVHVSVWVLYMWGITYVTAVFLFSAFAGDDFGFYYFATLVVFWAFIMSLFFVLLFSSTFIHEYAHIAAVRYFGGRVDEDKGVVLWPFGALAYLHLDGLTLSQEMLVTIVGPLSHAPQILLWYLLSLTASSTEDNLWRAITLSMVALNTVLLVWNLLPCYPMDGSRILSCALLLTRRIKVESAAWIVVIISYIASVSYIVGSLTDTFAPLAVFSNFPIDWIFGGLCVVATSNIAVMLKQGRIRDHPTFSRYEIVYDAYHAFDAKPHPEIFL